MAGKDITQKVIDFEFSRIQMKDEAQHHLFDEKSQTLRFSQWNLNNIIIGLGLTDRNSYSIKWVGYDENSYLDAFIYCLFKGCRNTEDGQNGTFVKLKFHIYQLAARFLKVSDQRAVVQTLCSAQYAKNLPLYLNRNRIIYNLFDKLLKSFLESSHCQYQQQMEDLKAFAKEFAFIRFQLINQSIGVFEHYGHKFYIINQKGCYFIIEDETQKIHAPNLRKIQENLEESQHEINVTNRNMQVTFVDHQNNFHYEQQPKRIYQYAAPKFIANGTMYRKKRNMDIQKERQKQAQPSDRRKNVAIPTKTTNEKKILQFRTTINNNMKHIGQNPENKNKSQPKEGRQRMKMYYKSPQQRVKTGIIHSSLQNKQLRIQSNSQSKSKQIVSDQNDFKKPKIKKQVSPVAIPQYNMKNPGFTFVSMLANDIFSQRNSCKQFTKFESPRNFESAKYVQNLGPANSSSTGFNNEKNFPRSYEKI